MEQIDKKNVSNYYESYFKYLNPHFNMEWYTELIWGDFGAELTNKEAAILDIGCGAGQLLKVLQNKGFTNLSGVEIDKGQYEEAKKIVPEATISNDDIFVFFKNHQKTYDYIFMVDVIEHMPKDKVVQLLSEIYKKLNKGGKFLIRTPNADSPLIASRFRYIDFTHTFILNQESMGTILREAGFNTFTFRASYIPRKGIKGFIVKLIQKTFDIILRLYLFTYIHEAAKRIILTPNFNTIAKRDE